MTRNKIMLSVAGISVALLGAALLGLYTVFSFLTILLLLASLATAAIEKGDKELDISPYGGFLAGLGILLVIGMAFVWLGWSPDLTADSFTYIAGLPMSTAMLLLFVWLLPVFGGSLYFAYRIFPETASRENVESTINEAKERQTTGEYPLSALGRERGGD